MKERLLRYGLIFSFEKLAQILKKEWKLIPQMAVRDAVDAWLSRVRAVEAAGGGHIEKN